MIREIQFGKISDSQSKNNGNNVEKIFKDQNEYRSQKRDQRCYYQLNIPQMNPQAFNIINQADVTFQESSLRIYSRGGSEFIVPLHFKVEDVYPIENGIIIKVLYDKHLLFFDPFQIRKDGDLAQNQLVEYAYLTIQDHPLSDIHPLSFGGKIDMIATTMELIHVEYKIPLVVIYSHQTKQVIFGLLKNRQEDVQMDEGNNEEEKTYIKSIDLDSRYPGIYNISKDFNLLIEDTHQFTSLAKPTKIHLSRSVSNPFEVIITMFYQSLKKIEFLSFDIRQPRQIIKINELTNIQDMEQVQFSQPKYSKEDSISIISKSKTQCFQQNEARISQLNFDLTMMKKRIKYLTKDTLICDKDGRNLQIYSGHLHIFTFDIYNLFTQQYEKSVFPMNSKIIQLAQPSKTNITIKLSNGEEKRISLNFQITDFLIKSIMKTLRVILPQQTYENLYQDLIETLARCNIEPLKFNQNESSQDQLTKFTNMIISILTGDRIKQQQQQTTQHQQVQSSSSPFVQAQGVSQNQTKPVQTIQTKILRSSTTAFDSMQRRKTVGIGSGQQQQQQQLFQQSQIQRTTQGSGQPQLRTVIGSQIQAQQRRTATSGGIESQPFQLAQGVQSSSQQASSNPFADLLNSDFHKENFKTKFSGLFPSEIKLLPPQPIVEQQQANPLQISPTKSSKGTPSTIAGRVSSNRKSTTMASSQSVQQQHERKNSNIAQINQPQPQPQVAQVNLTFKTTKNELMLYFQQIFQCLHLLYEDLKLNKFRDAVESPKLAKLLIKLALALDPFKKAAHIDYYLKEHPFLKDELSNDIKKAFPDGQLLKDNVEIENVPKIFKLLENSLQKKQSIINYAFCLFYENTRKIIRLYEILNNSSCHSYISEALSNNICFKSPDYITSDNLIFNRSIIIHDSSSFQYDLRDYLKMDKQNQQNLHPFEKILFTLKEEGLNYDELKKLPSIVSLPIIEIIRYARLFQQEIQTLPYWPDSLYKLIQREDILNNLRLFQRQPQAQGSSGGLAKKNLQQFQQELAFQKQASKKYALTRGMTNVFGGLSAEEMRQEENRKQMESNIIKTTADLINKGNFKQYDGKNPQQDNMIIDFLRNRFSSDTRFKEVQNMLSSQNEIIIKMEHIPNRESLAEEALNVEKQKLLDRMFLRHLSKCCGRGALTFGTVQTLPTETLSIPKINQTGYVPMSETYMQVEIKEDHNKDILQWPEFHNGVAAALRIAQSFSKSSKGDINQSTHTRNWIMYHKPPEPKYEHGGFLLAIGLLGQFDTLQPTDLYQHLKTTHDATTIGILLGRAASKIGTMDDHDTRTLCIHIPYLLPPSLSIDVSLSIQSAAVIGAGLLYKGTSNRLMTEMLLAQIGRKPLSDKAIEREGYALASGIALGLVNLGIGNKMKGLTDLKLDERLIRYVEGGKIMDLPQSMLSQNFNHDNTKCSSIKEGDMVNVHITSQGALIALALIHLKSNNANIASQLVFPQSFFSLESVRPAFLLQKVLCRNLIMWDEIQCSQQWVQSQVPQIIRDIYENDISTVEKKFQQKLIEDGIDYSTVALCYVNIIAGAIFSIGFKYAGTGNKEAFKLVSEYTHFFKKLKIVQSNKDSIGMIHNNFTKNQIDKNTVETCLCIAAFSMSMIMAGTGDVECFRILRVLRKRFEHDMHYGYNMAIHMSLGFLFLGSGAFTFSRNDLAIAALLCSLYPVFPSNPSDNRYHLQALRHFYVLAIESRLLYARDIDTGEFLNIKMKVEVEVNTANDQNQAQDTQTTTVKTLDIQTPDIINGKVRCIEVQNEKYHYVNLKFEQPQDESMPMEIDDRQVPFSGPSQFFEKKQKIFEQFDFQKIVYVKKKASYAIQENLSKLQSTKNQTTQILDINDQKACDIIEEYKNLQQNIELIKDPSIQQFFQIFLKYNSETHSSTEIEDVLLAQNRDNFSSLSPKEFFRIQDICQLIQNSNEHHIKPKQLTKKLEIIKTLSNTYFQDQLELFILLLDIHLYKEDDFKSFQKSNVLSSYLTFRSNLKEFSGKKNDIKIERCLDFRNHDPIKEGERLYDLMVNVNSFDYKERNLFSIDLHELQISKFIITELINEIRSKGENETLMRYKQSKLSRDLRIERESDIEIDQMLKMSLDQIFGLRDNKDYAANFHRDTVIVGLLKICD